MRSDVNMEPKTKSEGALGGKEDGSVGKFFKGELQSVTTAN